MNEVGEEGEGGGERTEVEAEGTTEGVAGGEAEGEERGNEEVWGG